jgi:hypothetical protein
MNVTCSVVMKASMLVQCPCPRRKWFTSKRPSPGAPFKRSILGTSLRYEYSKASDCNQHSLSLRRLKRCDFVVLQICCRGLLPIISHLLSVLSVAWLGSWNERTRNKRHDRIGTEVWNKESPHDSRSRLCGTRCYNLRLTVGPRVTDACVLVFRNATL